MGNLSSTTQSNFILRAAAILYELLYEGVFKVDRNSLGSCQRTSRASDLLSDDCMNVCMSSDESDLETEEALWCGK